jgi:hypothetical protein
MTVNANDLSFLGFLADGAAGTGNPILAMEAIILCSLWIVDEQQLTGRRDD